MKHIDFAELKDRDAQAYHAWIGAIDVNYWKHWRETTGYPKGFGVINLDDYYHHYRVALLEEYGMELISPSGPNNNHRAVILHDQDRAIEFMLRWS